MSPENVDRSYSEKSDVWSFGCCVVELLSSTIPYPHFQGDLAALSLAIRDHGLTPMDDLTAIIRSKESQVPEWCLELLSLCFKPTPEDRPSFASIVKLLEESHPAQYVSFMNKMESRDSVLHQNDAAHIDGEYVSLGAVAFRPEGAKYKKTSKKTNKVQGVITLNENLVGKQQKFEGQVAIKCKLGEGSFGAVYLAILEGRYIAVKQISASNDAAGSSLFTEAALMTKLKPHRNIIGVYGISVERKSISLLLEFASRGSLEGLLQKHQQTLPERLLFRFAIGIARGMASLTQQNIVHRDLATRNVLLDSSLEPKICDFGLSRIVERGDVGMTSSDGTLNCSIYLRRFVLHFRWFSWTSALDGT
jgi:serine/threonine protein kinase